jgi:thiopurine S-methyltransferase
MDPDFWHQRWNEGRTAFHQGKPNEHLVKHLARLGEGKRVLVPLCGKAEDLAWLAAQGHQVVGVELVETAVQAFFAERGVTPEVKRDGVFTRYTAGAITVLAGDFFATTLDRLGPIDALYDRAALIALPPTMRADYVEHLRALLPEGAPGLVVTVEYPQEQMAGPPFSVPEAELRAHYAGCEVELLDDVAADGRVGDVSGREKCFGVRF